MTSQNAILVSDADAERRRTGHLRRAFFSAAGGGGGLRRTGGLRVCADSGHRERRATIAMAITRRIGPVSSA